MGFLNKILVRPTLTIYVEGDKVVLHHDGEEVRADPVIRVADDGKVIAFGREAETTTGGRLIRLFTSGGNVDEVAVRVFCRYPLRVALDGVTFRRPKVEVVEPMFRRAFGAGAAEAMVKVLRSDRFAAELTDGR